LEGVDGHNLPLPALYLSAVAWVKVYGHKLRDLGLSPDDVRWVVLTHLHQDHDGGCIFSQALVGTDWELVSQGIYEQVGDTQPLF